MSSNQIEELEKLRQEIMNQTSGLSGSQKSFSTFENLPFMYDQADEINEESYKNLQTKKPTINKYVKSNQILQQKEEANIFESFESQISSRQKSPNSIFYPSPQTLHSNQEEEEYKQYAFERQNQPLFFLAKQESQNIPENGSSKSSECEKAVRKQILSLDLEESNEFEHSVKKKHQSIKKKKLNINSSSYISESIDKTQLLSTQKQEIFKIQQKQNEFQEFNSLKWNTTDFQQPSLTPNNQPQIESLSCQQFKNYYFSEQIQQQQQQQQQQQFLPQQNQQQILEQQLVPPSFISQSGLNLPKQLVRDQIIVQTIHNPFILEISTKVYTGYLKYFDSERQYGFIVIDEDNVEIFFHFQDVTHCLLTKEYLNLARDGKKIPLQFNICQYRGKQSTIRKKAVNLAPLT